MNKQTHHNITIDRAYERRKIRSNTMTKVNFPTYRAIANKSNVYNEINVVDAKGNVVVQMIDKGLKGTKVEKAFELGKKVATALKAKKVDSVVFDRNGFRYIGRIKCLCEGLREGGIAV